MGLAKILNNMSKIEKDKFRQAMLDPVKWAQIFIRIFDPVKKKVVPWVARWYQVEMLRDKSLKKVYRCGRRTGWLEKPGPCIVNCEDGFRA